MTEWKFINIVSDGQPININGINPWNYEWVALDKEPIEVSHPNYPEQKHKMWQYKIIEGIKTIIFAAGEYSNCVWGFYVPSA